MSELSPAAKALLMRLSNNVGEPKHEQGWGLWDDEGAAAAELEEAGLIYCWRGLRATLTGDGYALSAEFAAEETDNAA